jgi:hypothetical protein
VEHLERYVYASEDQHLSTAHTKSDPAKPRNRLPPVIVVS